MNAQKFFTVIFAFSLLGLVSCGDDDDNGNGDPEYCASAWATVVQDELNNVTTTAQAYGQDPENLAKCNAYKAALEDYIDALEPFENCTGWTAQTKSDWQQSINQAREDVADLCTGL